MNELSALTAKLIAFRDARDWRQFHTLKDLILSVSIEAAELLELVQWKTETELKLIDFSEEVADVFIYLLMICEKEGIDLIASTYRKIEANGRKYPIAISRGSNAKRNVKL